MTKLPEPAYYWEPDGTIEWMGKDGSGFSTNTGPAHGWTITKYYTEDQMLQFRRDALEESIQCYSPDDTAADWTDKIRKLKDET
jgi:hypothetical protein